MRIFRKLNESDLQKAYSGVRAFERQLKDGGTVILKFFLEISKKEQAARLVCPAGEFRYVVEGFRCRFAEAHRYHDYINAVERMFRESGVRVNPMAQDSFQELKSRLLSGASTSSRCFVRPRQATKEGGGASEIQRFSRICPRSPAFPLSKIPT